MTLDEKLNVIFFVCDLLSMPLLPLIRRKLGIRLLSPLRWFPLTFLVFLLACPLFPGALFWIEAPAYRPGPFGNGSLPAEVTASQESLRQAFSQTGPTKPRIRAGNGSGYLGTAAFLSLILAGRQRAARTRDIKNGIAIHSWSRGVSILSFLPLSLDTIHRTVEPMLAMVGGFTIAGSFSPALGYGLVISGLASGMAEAHIQKLRFERSLDAVDGMLESGSLAGTIQQFEQHPSATRVERGDVEIIHTKLAPDVEALIARRKRPGKQSSDSSLPKAAKPFRLWNAMCWLFKTTYAGLKNGWKLLVKIRLKLNPPPTRPLTKSQRFWRFFWGSHTWEWWERRRTK